MLLSSHTRGYYQATIRRVALNMMGKPPAFAQVKPLTKALTVSHFKAEEEPPELHRLTIPEAMIRTATEHPDTELYIFRDPEAPRVAITGKQLLRVTEVVAATLIEAGIQSGDRVGLLSSNCPEYVYADYGIIRAGAVVVRMQSKLRSGEDLLHIINKTECKGIIVVPGIDNANLDLLHAVFPAISKMDAIVPLTLEGVPSLEFVMDTSDGHHPGLRRLDLKPGGIALSQKQSAAVEARLTEVRPEDPCCLFQTSGSTGPPKLVTVNHSHLVNCTFSGLLDTRKGLNDRPLSNIIGCEYSMYAAVRGISCVILDPRTVVAKGNTDFFFKVIEEEQVDNCSIYPYLFHELMDILETKRFDLSSVKKGIAGGQVIPRNVLQKLIENMPGIVNAYGSTEAGPGLLQTRSSDPIDLQLDYSGYPLPHTEFRVLDHEGNIVPVNTAGMLYVKTPYMFVGYWEDEERTRAVKDAEGWYRTDDIAVMNERGYINILGRETEGIMKGSIIIYPVVVEKFLLTHPKIDKVIVVGVPDKRMIEEICACIVPVRGSDLTAKELEQFCNENLLTEESVDGVGLRPRYFLLWDTFPLNASQKIDKKAIKELAARELGLKQEW
ncbi:3-[(3aS,4S,7aS)-7a-methyl-1,5-dioxo-octahydro-1H-inden-4-yl]propanoyl:CoA ligase-like isoform X1 [Lineus longissimus]|uniref:3-[(3aS,4S,7aS)-7a-methyl-1, 5-dioxo-octahydro-1H-inden-4-yl]propanoyl:CoA ligase-like isoform X1 n=1 Tax=Lineus longissimus TaxID=88925 RepID=UPI00315D56D3